MLIDGISDSGKNFNNLESEDLAPVDEFHIRGRKATLELAQSAGLDSSMHVIDVGSGIGGPSRCLALEYNCRVTGIDLTSEYCKAATMLAESLGMSHLVKYVEGDAVKMPFDKNTFDVAWSQHAAMNIADKENLYREIFRVLKPGGRLAIHDILAGSSGPVLFPVPWARTEATSFLVNPDGLQELLVKAGFEITCWRDTTAPARAWFANMVENIKSNGLPPLGFHLLMGPDFKKMAGNQKRNLEEGRIVLVQVIAQKP